MMLCRAVPCCAVQVVAGQTAALALKKIKRQQVWWRGVGAVLYGAQTLRCAVPCLGALCRQRGVLCN